MITLVSPTADPRHGGQATRTADEVSVAVRLALPLGMASTVAAVGSLCFPGLLSGPPVTVGNLRGSGLLTSPVWVQDLAFWIPAAVVVSVLSWRRVARGAVLTAGLLAFYVAECLSVASDQWWGARADASHPDLASTGAVIGGVAAAVVTAVPLLLLLRHIGASRHDHPESR